MVAVVDWSHEAVLGADVRSVGLARAFVCRQLLAHDLSHLVDGVRLVISELATNAVLHARSPFTVTLSRTGELVLLVVRDGSAMGPMLEARDLMDQGGRGLVLVESLSYQWGARTDDGSKSVWASFRADGN